MSNIIAAIESNRIAAPTIIAKLIMLYNKVLN